MALSERQLSIAAALLNLSDDEIRGKSISDIDSEDFSNLTEEWYVFSSKADDILIQNGLGEECLDDLWRNVERVWLCVRMGHGVNFGDDPWANAELGKVVSKALNEAAKAQGGVDAYVGDDGRVYIV